MTCSRDGEEAGHVHRDPGAALWYGRGPTLLRQDRASPARYPGDRGVRGALVHLRLEGKTPPNPRPLSASRLAPDGFRASGRQHPVQDRHTNGRFGLLGHKSTGSQPRSDQRLVAAHCRFDERPLAVSSRNLPSQASLFRDHLQVAVTLSRCTQFAAWTAVERGGITTSMPSPCAAIVW